MTNGVLSFGSDCKVIQPQDFVDRIIEYLEVMAKSVK
jgi:predicted DNA-binding transcriptional regulator YafY